MRKRAFLLAIGLAAGPGCRQAAPPGAPASERPAHAAGARTIDAAGLSMAERLALIDENTDPDQILSFNARKAAALKGLVEAETDPVLRASLQWKYADQLLKAGDSAGAIRQYEMLERVLNRKQFFLPGVARRDVWMGIALAYLRLGEQENCILNHSSDSCLLPIQGQGVHRAKRGSRGAIRYLTRILEVGDDYSARWLLNIAYMTLGEYPVSVPSRWRISPAAFNSDCPFPRFPEVAGSLGLDLRQLSGGTITEDFDGDGLLDVMVSSIGVHDQIRLFRNNGNCSFSDRTKEAGLIGETGGLNLLQADFDNDGHPDVLILRGAWFGRMGHWPLSLLRNRGDGTFEDVTERAGLLRFHPTQTAVWFDYNGDGSLDLFVGNESRPDDENPCELFRNNGDGTFTECARECNLAVVGFIKGVVSADYNNDGRPDLFLSDHGRPNRLYRNDGPAVSGAGPASPWKFTDVSLQAGIRNPISSFSCFFFDYDNDGLPDLYVTGYSYRGVSVGDAARDYLGLAASQGYPALYHNNGNGTFTEVSERMRARRVSFGMGINFGDLDNDGWLDFYVGTGTPDLAFLTPNRMMRNDRGLRFQDVTSSGGFGHLQKGHAISFADLNNDGTQDVFESMGGIYDGDLAYDCLYENPGFGNHWITVKLEGTKCNRSAIGARIKIVTLESGKRRAIHRTVGSGGSFGASPLRQEIGLGKSSSIQEMQIVWPSGKTQQFPGLSMDRSYFLREGDASPAVLNLRKFAYGASSSHSHHH